MSAELPSNSPKTRSFAFSIGQLTFGSILLVLAVIIITSAASVIAIRHIDQTFAELQRLQSVGDLAEDIDRRMNELRLAARDFVTDPGTQSMQVAEAATALVRGPEKDAARTCARAAGHDRRRHRTPYHLPQRHRADFVPDQPPRRPDRRAAALARKVRHGRRRQPGSRPHLDPVPDPKPHRFGLAGAQPRGRGGRGPKHAGACRFPIRTCARPSTIMPRRSSPSRSGNARSPISTRKCWAPRAG